MKHCHSFRSRASRTTGYLAVLAATAAMSDGNVEPLEARMAPEDFERAGLHKLQAAELRYLNAWLQRETNTGEHVSATSGDAQAGPEFGAEQLDTKKDTPRGDGVSTRIKGRFLGWDGATLFRLENGQTWQQRVRGRYRHAAENPAVRIERGRFGYFLVLLATGRRVGVVRIE